MKKRPKPTGPGAHAYAKRPEQFTLASGVQFVTAGPNTAEFMRREVEARADAQTLRARGSKNSAINRREKNIVRNRLIHEAHEKGVVPKKIADEKQIFGRRLAKKKHDNRLKLVYRVLSDQRP